MSKQIIYPPLSLLKRVGAAFPEAWEQMEYFHQSNGTSGLPKWEPWCYAPIAAALAVVQSKSGAPNIDMDTIVSAQRIAALAPWRISKEVFIIDPDLAQLLYEQDDLSIPSDILLQLPYPAFYIQSEGLCLGGDQYHGFFVHLEHDINSGDRELRLLYLAPDGATMGFLIHIDSADISASLQRTLSEAEQNNPDLYYAFCRVPGASFADDLRSLLLSTLQIILYICAENAEIAPNSEQAFITRRTDKIKDRYAEIRKWDVGFRIGAAIRKYNRVESPEDSDDQDRHAGKHASPRPHMRRGHWHHYWVGSRSDPDTRKLILKWTPPTIVGTQQENAPIVYHIKNLEDKND
ncbi:MAG: hypothetical protein U0N08_01860 [Oscillospiraceae bacterium]